MRLRHCIAAVLTTAALVVTLPTSAGAATGTFGYISPESGGLDIISPANGECRLLLHGASSALNGTNATATLYSDRGCEEPLVAMAPGEARDFGGVTPHSVMFG
ncbi:hypothetical protein [Streptomyces sp. NPDC059072]|uniref:hypothetical protein n=1 Tax=unclassified Streptomyces TaxID=2593676 RepID=UPI0036B3C6D7